MTIISITADVEVDLDDVIEAASEDELKRAIRRKVGGVSDAIFGGFFAYEKQVKRDIWQAILNEDFQAVAELVAPYVSPDEDPRAKSYQALPRDPATGRPVIQ